MSLTLLQELHSVLDKFQSASPATKAAAADLTERFTKRIQINLLSKEEQYRLLAQSASARTPQCLQNLEDLKTYSIHESIRTAAAEELDPRTSLFGGTAKRQMAGESTAMI